MKKKVIATIQKYQMLKPGMTIVVAASGGVDSMVLLHVLSEMKDVVGLTLVVAHVDHARRADSGLDARLVRQVAKAYGFAYEEMVLPSGENRGNFHAYARTERYLFFQRVAVLYGAAAVATAHHGNDHLETVVDRITRSDTPASLIGIQPNGFVDGVAVIRPLIEITKEALYAYAQAYAVSWREDPSNVADCYMRNRIRKAIVPKLLEERNDVLVHVRNLSDALASDEAYFAMQVDELMSHVTSSLTGYEMALSWLRQVHPSLKRRLLTRLIPGLSKGALQDLMHFIAQAHTTARLDIGDQKVARKAYGALYLTTKQSTERGFYEVSLVMDEQVKLPTGEKVFLFQGMSEKSEKSNAQATYLCYNKIRLPLKVRNRKSGDRIQLLNQKGHAKVKQIMIDAKVPVEQRAAWPIVVDQDDTILWIPGLKKSPTCLEKAGSSDDILIVFQ